MEFETDAIFINHLQRIMEKAVRTGV